MIKIFNTPKIFVCKYFIYIVCIYIDSDENMKYLSVGWLKMSAFFYRTISYFYSSKIHSTFSFTDSKYQDIKLLSEEQTLSHFLNEPNTCNAHDLLFSFFVYVKDGWLS